MKTIYLFKEHEKYQVGKSKLNKGSVYETNIFWISLALFAAIGLMALAGNSLRLQWRFEQSGAETIGTIIDCDEVRGSKGGYTTYVNYSFVINDITYTDRDRVSGGRACHAYPNNSQYQVYYLSDAPTESGIGAFLHNNDWTDSWIYAIVGTIVTVFVFYLLMKNRKELYKYTLLQRHADVIIDAEVEKIGEVKGKNGYRYANYVFTSPDMGIINGQIRSGKGYRWPKLIERRDTLKILYYDSDNYCVL